ncbi:MAG: ATP-binding cassette domain-containing protein [Chthoniobacterales bacterium]|nr:ATP-binding cassette domain-containing protein [Chthoniobacterales bacterium]
MSAAAPDLLLHVEGLHKQFGDRTVLADVHLDIPRGSIFSVLGPSGAGKSVFLKCLADILRPDAGKISFDGQLLGTGATPARAEFRRRCSFLFQSNALFDSLTALENVALPLEQTTDLPLPQIRERSLGALRELELEDCRSHYPSQLSGGMQKRLALARAIVTRPELVFFDEPTAGLDPLRRNAVFTMIAQYQRQFGFTALIVTHDVTEAIIASDRVALLNQGRIGFVGAPSEFSSSQLPVVRDFRDSTAALENSLTVIRRGEPLPSVHS